MVFGSKKTSADDADHKCTLQQEEDIMVRYLSTGYCVRFRRFMKRMTMVSEVNPRSKMYLKSTFNIRREKIRHLEDYYNMIHPFSTWKCYWEFFMIAVLITLLTVVPVLLCFKEISFEMLVFRLVLDFFCLVDILMIFNTGYQDTKTKRVIFNRKKVAANYLKTWFTPDVLAFLNTDFVVFFLNYNHKDLWLLKFLNVMKILRIFSLMTYMNRLREYFQSSIFKFKIFKLVLIVFLLMLWATCLLFIIAREVGEDWVKHADDLTFLRENLMRAFIDIFNFFLLIDHYSSPETQSSHVLAFEITALAIGVILQLFILSQIMQGVEKMKTSQNKYNDKNQQLRNYMQSKQVPRWLARRCQSYFDFKFQKSYYKESEIIHTISSGLKSEINYHICVRLLQNVDILKDIPLSVIMDLTGMMEEEIYLPNDIITKAGEVGTCMYFISSGMVALYTPGGKEICHVTDGGNFGEVCMTMEHSSRVATVVAVDYCDLYVLSRKNFLKAIENQPEIYKRTLAISKKRMADIMNIEHTRNRPSEFYDMRTPEGIDIFKESLYEL